jgi:hypothetical protein
MLEKEHLLIFDIEKWTKKRWNSTTNKYEEEMQWDDNNFLVFLG